jgi:hypothetical protein
MREKMVRKVKKFFIVGLTCALPLAKPGSSHLPASSQGKLGVIVRNIRRFVVGGLAGALSLAAIAAGSARADTVTSVPELTNFHQMVADPAAGYLFSSANGGIVVTDLTGAFVATVDAGDGVQGLALSADGSTLYAAITAGANANSVAAITAATANATTPTQSFFALAAGDVPYSLALQSGILWTSYTDSAATVSPGRVGDFLLPAGTFEADTSGVVWAVSPDLAADPSDTGVLAAVMPNVAQTGAETYNTKTDPPTTLAPVQQLGTGATACSDESQIAVAPGGGQLLAACRGTGSTQVYNTADLSAGTPGDYPTTHAAAGAAVDADGTVAVASFNNPGVVDVYKPDRTLLNALNLGADSLGNSYTLVYPNGLTWVDGATGPELAVVIQDAALTNESVMIIGNPELPRATLTLRGPGDGVRGRAFTLNGTLTMTNGGALPVGGTLSVTRNGPGGQKVFAALPVASNGSYTLTDTPPATGTYAYTAHYTGVANAASAASASTPVTVLLNTSRLGLSGPATSAIGKTMTIKGGLLFGVGTVPAGTAITVTRTAVGTIKKVFAVKTAAGGAFTLTDAPTVATRFTYAAAYAGSASTAKAAASHVVTVTKLTPSLSLATNASTFNYQSTVHLTAHLGGTYANRVVSVYARPYGVKALILVKTGRVNAAGNMTASYTVRTQTTFSVVFNGDARYTTRTVYRGVNVRASVAMKLSGYYGTSQSGGQTYLLYHQGDNVNITVTVAPGKVSGCVELELQEYVQGAWSQSAFTNCAALNSAGQVPGYLTTGNANIGYPYRIKADYVSSGGSNVNNDSGWQYIMFEP